jgi:hypothetical protein
MSNLFQVKRKKGGWLASHIAIWTEGSTAYISCVFSWDLVECRKIAKYYAGLGFTVRAGGPAVAMNPGALKDVAELGGQVAALPYHNPKAMFTSRGCIRQCPFCAVPKIEGDLVELSDWEPKPLVCDNNLLACSTAHFDSVIDRLKAASVRGVDFNQGLDARLLTKYHAQRISELDLGRVRLAWDDIKLESQFMRAWQLLRGAGIPKRAIAVYVLIGFNDTPEDAEYRLRTIYDLDSFPSPMRYQPVDTKTKDAYVGKNWEDWQLRQYMRYWSNRRLAKIPFSEWLDGYRPQTQNVAQMSF